MLCNDGCYYNNLCEDGEPGDLYYCLCFDDNSVFGYGLCPILMDDSVEVFWRCCFFFPTARRLVGMLPMFF